MTHGSYRLTTPAPERPSIHHSHNVRRLERIETIIEKLLAVRKYAQRADDLADLDRALEFARAVWNRWEPLVKR